MNKNQVFHLHEEADRLQKIYGAPKLNAIYGAGKTDQPDYFFIFMNPTGRNITADPNWTSLRAPWLGTKQIWKLFLDLDMLSQSVFDELQTLKPNQWSPEFSTNLYSDIADHSVYITNLAKCTQIDARPLNNSVFKEYLTIINDEISFVRPKFIITLGNQVSSIVLNKPISVKDYLNTHAEIEIKGQTYKTYPTYYPVGQGRRNMPLTIARIKGI